MIILKELVIIKCCNLQYCLIAIILQYCPTHNPLSYIAGTLVCIYMYQHIKSCVNIQCGYYCTAVAKCFDFHLWFSDGWSNFCDWTLLHGSGTQVSCRRCTWSGLCYSSR